MSAYFDYQNPPLSRDTQADLTRVQDHFEQLGRRMFADAIDADRLVRGEDPKATLTEARVFDDDIEVMRFACHKCGSQRWRWLGTRFLGENNGVDVEVDEHECAEYRAMATW
jgi:hypothetical protein